MSNIRAYKMVTFEYKDGRAFTYLYTSASQYKYLVLGHISCHTEAEEDAFYKYVAEEVEDGTMVELGHHHKEFKFLNGCAADLRALVVGDEVYAVRVGYIETINL